MFSQYFVTRDSYKTIIKKIKYFNKVYIYIYNTYNTYSNVTIYIILIYAYSSIYNNVINIPV